MKILTSAQLKRRLKKVISWVRCIWLENRTFSILSNNCWGGAIYDMFGLIYRTPTIGLWIPAHDYIKFISNLDFYLKQELIQINYRDCHVVDLLIKRRESGKYKFSLDSMIIGRLYDVDIVFLHYHSFSEAVDKWKRRKERISLDNLIVKFNDQNGFMLSDYEEFKKLPYKHKIFITANSSLAVDDGVILLKEFSAQGYVEDDTKLSKLPMDLKNYLNSIH